jgi:hypothetical protein
MDRSKVSLSHYCMKKWAFCAIKQVDLLRDGFPNGG